MGVPLWCIKYMRGISIMKPSCIFCETESTCYNINWTCPCCGKYQIDADTLSDLRTERVFQQNKHLLSGYIREMNDYNEIPVIRYDTYKTLLNHSLIPTTPLQKVEKLLAYVYRNTKMLYESVPIPLHPAIGYCLNQDELLAAIRCAGDMGYLMPNEAAMVIKSPIYKFLSVKGLEKAEELKKQDSVSKQGFVAMWFDEGMLKTFDEFIAPAIEDAGYKPFIIPMKEHNDDITDHIIAEIRRSKFLVADFTGHRGGVYFEAGFAYGLGLPVIWTCKDDWFNPPGNTARRVHFDVDHYNFIVWQDGADLRQKLVNRIRATVV
jgi:nucleoside 2-deoxyribosyltransferase